MKTAILIISNPDAGDEALARLINGLVLAQEARADGDEIEVAFIGTGTRWPERLTQLTHPANALYNAVREVVVGASRSCANRWKTAGAVEACGLPLIADRRASGTPEGLSIRRYLADGWQTLIF